MADEHCTKKTTPSVVPVYASVAELIAAGTPTTAGTKVTVTLTDEEITRFHTLKGGIVAGAIIKVGSQEVEIFCEGTPSDWEVGGTISGTLTNCDWKLYNSTWELCPVDYSELTYKAPLTACATPVITIAEDGAVSISCETAGATIHYTVGENPADPTEADAVFSTVTLTDGQTIKAIAVAEGFKPSAVASKKYTVGDADIKTATLTKEDIIKLGKLAYATENTLTKDNFTWSLKAYKDQDARPWAQIKKDVGAYVKLSAPKPIKEVRLTITSAQNSSGGIADITKHTAYSGDIHLKTVDTVGNSDTNDVAKTSTVTNNISTLVPTGSSSELYIKVSAGARIWGIEVDY